MQWHKKNYTLKVSNVNNIWNHDWWSIFSSPTSLKRTTSNIGLSRERLATSRIHAPSNKSHSSRKREILINKIKKTNFGPLKNAWNCTIQKKSRLRVPNTYRCAYQLKKKKNGMGLPFVYRTHTSPNTYLPGTSTLPRMAYPCFTLSC